MIANPLVAGGGGVKSASPKEGYPVLSLSLYIYICIYMYVYTYIYIYNTYSICSHFSTGLQVAVPPAPD